MTKKSRNILLIVLAVVVVIAIGGLFTVNIVASNIAKSKIDKSIERYSVLADIQYEDVKVNALNKSLIMKNVQLDSGNYEEPIYIDTIKVFNTDIGSNVPKFANIKLQGIKLPNDYVSAYSDLNTSAILGEEVLMDIGIGYKFDSDTKSLNIEEFSIDYNDLFKINLGLNLGNLDMDVEEASELLYAYSQVVLSTIEVTFEDYGFINKLLNKSAKEEGISKDELIQELLDDIDTENFEMYGLPANIKTVVSNLFNNSESVRLDLNAKTDVPLFSLIMEKDFEKFLSSFDISVSNY